uniref:Uncharacterized protein n=1 Tax=Oryza glumipatula TaxID=40148 RepID=A0A0D9YSW4_9ORYZ
MPLRFDHKMERDEEDRDQGKQRGGTMAVKSRQEAILRPERGWKIDGQTLDTDIHDYTYFGTEKNVSEEEDVKMMRNKMSFAAVMFVRVSRSEPSES